MPTRRRPLLADAPGIAPQDVMVVIRHNRFEDWSFGGGVAQMLNAGDGPRGRWIEVTSPSSS